MIVKEEPRLPKTIIDERTCEKLILVNDYYYPAWCIEYEKYYNQNPLTRYMRDRIQFLLNNHKTEYTVMMCCGELDKHLRAIDEEAIEMEDFLVEQMMKKQGVTEELKRQNQMEWVGKVNNIKACVKEIIYDEIIYRPL